MGKVEPLITRKTAKKKTAGKKKPKTDPKGVSIDDLLSVRKVRKTKTTSKNVKSVAAKKGTSTGKKNAEKGRVESITGGTGTDYRTTGKKPKTNPKKAIIEPIMTRKQTKKNCT